MIMYEINHSSSGVAPLENTYVFRPPIIDEICVSAPLHARAPNIAEKKTIKNSTEIQLIMRPPPPAAEGELGASHIPNVIQRNSIP